MLSLHHITHAVCFIIISVLLKKHLELRSSHSNLRLEHSQLRVACKNLHTSEQADPNFCLCPCQSQQHFLQASSFMTPFSTSAEHARQSSSASAQQMFAGVSDSQTSVPVDEFGRSIGNAGEKSHAGVEIQGSASSTHFIHQSQPVPYNAPSQQPSVSSSCAHSQQTTPELTVSRQHIESSTADIQEVSVSFQTTRESLEEIKPSPSSVFRYSNVQSSTVDNLRDVAGQQREDDDNDFYQGSHFREENGEEEVDVIVTSVSGRVDSGFYPHGVQESFDEYNGEDYEEWEEEEEEEKPHPAFGNVELQWLTRQEVEEMSQQGSSVQCTGSHLSDRMCHFRNLCFNPKSREFVYLLSPHSVQDNVPDQDSQEALLELSTVAGHNAQYFSYITVPATKIKDFNVAPISGTTVVFKRFKPDNIMHVFHDDIIPFFQTLISLNVKPGSRDTIKFPVALFFADENNEGEFYEVYDVFASNSAFTSNSLIASVAKTTSDSLVCFANAYVGLTKTTTWYQYGFFEPQGPIPKAHVQSEHVHNVASYLLSNFANECALCGDGSHLVLISRKETRRILNEMELVMALSKEFRVKVMTVSLETHQLADILPIIHSSLGIIGMHGSLLSLAAFLKQGSILVELFPFAVNPHNYTPYATLCGLPGKLVAYRAWTNQDAERSVPHPDWSPEFGGLHHLPLQQQQEIVSQMDVPRHLCCEDPSWLYHIFQDTYVDIPQVLTLVSSALQEAAPLRIINTILSPPSTRLPGPVQNLHCVPEYSANKTSLLLEWTTPWNVEVSVNSDVSYSVVLQEVASGRTFAVDAGSVIKVKITEALQRDTEYRVWVKSFFDGVVGPFAAVQLCSTK